MSRKGLACLTAGVLIAAAGTLAILNRLNGGNVYISKFQVERRPADDLADPKEMAEFAQRFCSPQLLTEACERSSLSLSESEFVLRNSSAYPVAGSGRANVFVGGRSPEAAQAVAFQIIQVVSKQDAILRETRTAQTLKSLEGIRSRTLQSVDVSGDRRFTLKEQQTLSATAANLEYEVSGLRSLLASERAAIEALSGEANEPFGTSARLDISSLGFQRDLLREFIDVQNQYAAKRVTLGEQNSENRALRAQIESVRASLKSFKQEQIEQRQKIAASLEKQIAALELERKEKEEEMSRMRQAQLLTSARDSMNEALAKALSESLKREYEAVVARILTPGSFVVTVSPEKAMQPYRPLWRPAALLVLAGGGFSLMGLLAGRGRAR